MKTNELQKIEQIDIKDEATALISQAIDKNVDVATLERLLAMRDKIMAQKAEEEFYKSLAAFQAECPTVEKRKKVSFGTTNYSYAPLEDIVEQVKPLLHNHGFSYMFDTETNGKMKVICKVKHIAGHSEVATFNMEIDTNAKMNVSQKYGSALTYAKRYAFCAAFAINVKDEDTDANAPQNTQTSSPVASPLEAAIKPYRGASINTANAVCFSCHAPSMKPHGSGCEA